MRYLSQRYSGFSTQEHCCLLFSVFLSFNHSRNIFYSSVLSGSSRHNLLVSVSKVNSSVVFVKSPVFVKVHFSSVSFSSFSAQSLVLQSRQLWPVFSWGISLHDFPLAIRSRSWHYPLRPQKPTHWRHKNWKRINMLTNVLEHEKWVATLGNVSKVTCKATHRCLSTLPRFPQEQKRVRAIPRWCRCPTCAASHCENLTKVEWEGEKYHL